MRSLFTSSWVLVWLFAPLVEAKVIWRGDFESGDRSQFSSAQMVSPDRLSVVSTPTRQGRHALRVEVRNGDDPINASGYRNELVRYDRSVEGSEYYYAWSTLLPQDYPMSSAWQVLIQWHHPGCCGAPPVRMVLGCSAQDCGQPLSETLFFIVDGKTLWKLPKFPLGKWQDFILHIKWSANRSVGFVELWHDGRWVLSKTFTRTMFSSSDVNYLKLGLYRDVSIQKTGVLYHDGLIQATTFQEAYDALSGTPTSPPAPTKPPPDGGVPNPVVPEEGPTPDASAAPPPGRDGGMTDLKPVNTEIEPVVAGCQSTSVTGFLPFFVLSGLWASRRRGATSARME